MSNLESEPTFFSFVDSAIIWTKLYTGLPIREFGDKIYIIEFAAQALEDPKVEPIAVYYYAGIRRYFWRGIYWSEYNADAQLLSERTKELLQQVRDKDMMLNFRKLIDMLKFYSRRSWVITGGRRGLANVPFTGEHHTAIVFPIKSI